MSRAAVARTAGAAVLAAIWALCAVLLWRTSVPGSLRLPHIDQDVWFSPAQLRATRSFARVDDLLWLGGVLVQLAVFAVYAWQGPRFARESAAGPLGTGMLLGMLGFAFLWLAELPFDVLGLWWQRRHHLTSEGYFGHVFGNWLALGGRFVFLCAALAVVMGLARWIGRAWWLAAAPVFVGLALLFAFVSPWLLSTHSLRDPRLAAQARALERSEGVAPTPVVVQSVHDVTSLPNAEATGIGPSRRVVLWDTLLDGRFGDRELRVVIAHEIGHLRHGHIWKSVGWYALFAFPIAFLVALGTRRRGGLGQPEAVPLALLLLVVLGLLATPAENAITRHLEAEADWSALRATRDPSAAEALFRRFVPTTLSEPDPPTWDYVLLENHPTIAQRLAMAEAWRARGERAAPGR